MINPVYTLALVVVALFSLSSYAADKSNLANMNHESMDHETMDHSAMSEGESMPTEGGQN